LRTACVSCIYPIHRERRLYKFRGKFSQILSMLYRFEGEGGGNVWFRLIDGVTVWCMLSAGLGPLIAKLCALSKLRGVTG